MNTKPKKRSKVRLLLGTGYFTMRRYAYWHLSGARFAQERTRDRLPVEVATHESILLRKLKDVDMWMQHNKIQNLRLAIMRLDGLVLNPGETFSYWRLIGKPTKRQGYVEGMVLHDGSFRAGIGGGLCQLSNLIFWMTLHTSLTVTERWRHSYDVFPDAGRTLPFGSGATCSYPNIDLQIRNDTDRPFQLRLGLTHTHLVGTWLSEVPPEHMFEVVERDHEMRQEAWGGYTRHNELWRYTYSCDTGALLDAACICKNSAVMMYAPFLENSREN